MHLAQSRQAWELGPDEVNTTPGLKLAGRCHGAPTQPRARPLQHGCGGEACESQFDPALIEYYSNPGRQSAPYGLTRFNNSTLANDGFCSLSETESQARPSRETVR